MGCEYEGGRKVRSLEAALVLVTNALDRIFVDSAIEWREICGRFEYTRHRGTLMRPGNGGKDKIITIYPAAWDNDSEIECRVIRLDSGAWKVEEGVLNIDSVPELDGLGFICAHGTTCYIKPIKEERVMSKCVRGVFRQYRTRLLRETRALMDRRKKSIKR